MAKAPTYHIITGSHPGLWAGWVVSSKTLAELQRQAPKEARRLTVRPVKKKPKK